MFWSVATLLRKLLCLEGGGGGGGGLSDATDMILNLDGSFSQPVPDMFMSKTKGKTQDVMVMIEAKVVR